LSVETKSAEAPFDFMDSTLDGARERILELLDAERDAHLKVTAANN
jgi:hypothetical protein